MASKQGKRPAPTKAQATMLHFGPRLRELRQARDLSQRELARLLAIDYMQVNRYERGINVPSADTIARLARILQVSTDDLLFAEKTPQPPEIRSVALFERFRVLDTLPKEAQDTALEILDGVIAKHELAKLADRIRRSA